MAEKDQADPKAVFRIPGVAYLAIALLVVCVIPLAFGGIPGLQALLLVPVALIVFVARTRTTAHSGGLTVSTVFGQRELPWEVLKGFVISKSARVSAVLSDDSKVGLPTVRTRHLPVIAVVSGGRMKDPSGLTDTPDEE
ncbi:PH domain-containing protein [Amycolatopsis sp. NPDC059657]|uniref:PH domain-containing protein n=1 Tax=Amycolatopsis sp. NPDC059657 TaxID=3346899 RepID=UPI00366AA8D4